LIRITTETSVSLLVCFDRAVLLIHTLFFFMNSLS
jgi:hypothetical protein